eukprot:TRINITY_DN17283_c0_g1_i1.p1 TRINITY_DN17283_c0_g1~~TRINITY_DN17283_c0_g1_i1.p1  ORF type:complete len:911 (-),score=204.54 TRINITY_DN17283_c0_g1_i1:24-2756(-)
MGNGISGRKDELTVACTKGDEKEAEQYIQAASKIRKANALHAAVSKGHTQVTRFLLDNEADINWRMAKGEVEILNGAPPLMVAVFKGHKEVVELLLSRDANPFLTNTSGTTCAILAQGSADTALQELFLDYFRKKALFYCEKGDLKELTSLSASAPFAEILKNCVNSKKATPLHISSTLGFSDVVQFLVLRGGVPIDPLNNKQETPLMKACKKGHADIASFLLQKSASISLISSKNMNAIQYAKTYQHDKIVKQILDTYGSKLSSCCQQNNLKKVKEFLADKGLSDPDTFQHVIEWKNDVGETALCEAAKSGKGNIAKYLLQKKANIDTTTKDNDTPLIIACRRGRAKIVSILIDHKASIDPTKNPLLLVIEKGHLEVLKILVQGIDVNGYINGQSLLHYASKTKHSKLIQFLIEAKCNVDLPKEKNLKTALFLACKKGKEKNAKLLITNKANMETTIEDGTNPLFIAVTNRHTEVVKCLLLQSAKIDVQNKQSLSPLHIACSYGNDTIADVLVKNKADLNIKTEDGITPLMMASQAGSVVMVRLLLNHKADITVTDKNGWNALKLAVENEKWIVDATIRSYLPTFTKEEVYNFIKINTELKEYAPNFMEAEVDGNKLMSLTDEDLKNIGIKAMGSRKKFEIIRDSLITQPQSLPESSSWIIPENLSKLSLWLTKGGPDITYKTFVVKDNEKIIHEQTYNILENYLALLSGKIEYHRAHIINNEFLSATVRFSKNSFEQRIKTDKSVFQRKDWQSNSNHEIKKKVFDRASQFITQFPMGKDDIPVVPLVYGTTNEKSWKIAETGFHLDGERERFGRGIYFTTNLEYAHKKGDTLIIALVVTGNIYPVAEDHVGAPVQLGYQSHFVTINPTTEQFQSPQTGECCDEVVIFSASQALPLFILETNEKVEEKL